MDDQVGRRRSKAFLWIAAALAAAAFVGALLIRRRREERASRPLPRPQPLRPQAVLDLQGLTEAEAAARRLKGQDNTIRFKPPYSICEIFRANTLTIFNLSLVGLAAVQVLLGKWLDAFLTTGMLIFGIGLNVSQQLFARWLLQRLERTTRPQATVIREGTVRSIDASGVVRGDILVVGPGDQILVDGLVRGEGQIVVDESMVTGDPRQHVKQAGEPVYAGSFCIAGHGACQAQKVGDERLIVSLTGKFHAVGEELTPLERTIDRLLRILLVAVAVLSLLLLADYFDLVLPMFHVDAFASAASVIFGLAPSSLFLMILVNYAMGSAGLKWAGALVHRSRSVESLAQATVVCFAQSGILTGVGVEMEPVGVLGTQGGAQRPRLAESRIRQILGDFARGTSADNPVVQAMLAAFPGDQRRICEEAPFLSVYGWSAVAFDDSDLRGVYVLGDPELLEAHLASDYRAPWKAKGGGSLTRHWRERLTQMGRILRRSVGSKLADAPPAEPSQGGYPDPSVPAKDETRGPGLLQHLVERSQEIVRGKEEKPGEGEAEAGSAAVAAPGAVAQETATEEMVYLAAYRPDLVPLHSADGTLRLPRDLIPMCRLHYTKQVRPEAVETVRAFSQKGVSVKVFSSDEPKHTAAVLEQAGLSGPDDKPLRAISGHKLTTLDREQMARAAVENTIFGQVTPQQAGQVVDSLRQQSEVVAVVGDGVNDLPAMQQAHLSITRQSSSPAALSVADIILLEDSPQTLLRVLDKGQRIANSLLDILKLYLNQISYLTLLILAIWGMGMGFPYQSKQGSLITIVSVILPSLGLSLWAPAGVLPRAHLGWLLARFVAPAAVTMSAAAVVVYRMFLGRTGEVAYAQLATTYMLVISGLVLVILLRPPVRPKVGGDERSGDWRPTALVLVLLVLVFVAASIPLAEDIFGLTHLRQPVDYLVVGLAVLAWAAAASFIWRVAPLKHLGQLSRG